MMMMMMMSEEEEAPMSIKMNLLSESYYFF